MTLLYLSDILKKAGLNLSEVLLIRYDSSNKHFEKYLYEKKCLKEYIQIQLKNHFSKKECKYWIVFFGNGRNSVLLVKCYKVTKFEQNVAELDLNDTIKEIIQAKCSKNEPVYFDIEETDLLNNFEDRLIIDWRTNPGDCYQTAENEKEIIAIQPKQKKKFEGYENLTLTYEELREIVKNKLIYGDWHTALASIYAIYLIEDKKNGKKYVGSAYGKGGLLKRWSEYVKTKHGKNEQMKELLEKHPKRYTKFQFSILQICPKSMTDSEMVGLEKSYKEKFSTIKYGYNGN